MTSHHEALRVERLCVGNHGNEILDNFYLNVFAGEVVGLCGMEDSGRREFVDCLSGNRMDFTGTIILNELRFNPTSPTRSLRSGICVVGEQSVLIDTFSAIENLELIPRSLWSCKRRSVFRSKCRRLFQSLCPQIDPDIPVQELTSYERVTVEIARAVLSSASILVLDGVLADFPNHVLKWFLDIFGYLRRLKIAVLIVDTFMKAILQYVDRTFVLRGGINAGIVEKRFAKNDIILAMMTGDISIKTDEDRLKTRAPRYSNEDLLVLNDIHMGIMLNGLSLRVKKGEVVGILNSNMNTGRYLIDILKETQSIDSGSIQFNGKDIAHCSIRERQALGLYVSAIKNACFSDMSLRDNIMIPALCRHNIMKTIDQMPELKYEVSETIDAFWPERLCKNVPTLSSKEEIFLVICRAVVSNAKLLVMRNASHGMDMRMKEEVAAAVNRLRDKGIAALFVDYDVDFLVGLCDRIVVVSRGHVVKEFKVDSHESRESCRQFSTRIFSL